MIERAGFSAAYMSGFSLAASVGKPDIGLLTMTDVLAHAKAIAQSVSIPLIADADTGYGGLLNVIETVRCFEAAGIAGIQLEDQVTPKKCGALAGKELVSIGLMQDKIRAAVAARTDPDFIIIGRTDALANEGLDEALRRLKAWEEAGADATMVLDLSEESQMRAVAAAATRPTIMLPMSNLHQKISKLVTAQALEKMGFSMVIHPSILLLAMAAAHREVLKVLKADGGIDRALPLFAPFSEINQVLDTEAIIAMGARFTTTN